ncbi:type II toxin-antitoxin system HicA family toxin [Carboxydochorda subterranea]|uniref:Type II toxin-antitoxin system HicA family toxin n=1 Tax=Carboxydichorda subterranea TaxID=3109565 RepID=A0ABZ1C0Y9_9FIRM|nr:type II toxin-antitoxin system HicA family toxin [Limnochorda sp. L945t]WRP18692.1 type II toxin-antitoxin system HicA family toxin [Limnochorda sp. L945t]
MSPRAPRVTGAELVRALQRAGFRVVRIKGSHHHLRREGSSLVTVPVHRGEIIYPRLLMSILDQAGLTVEELRRLLNNDPSR